MQDFDPGTSTHWLVSEMDRWYGLSSWSSRTLKVFTIFQWISSSLFKFISKLQVWIHSIIIYTVGYSPGYCNASQSLKDPSDGLKKNEKKSKWIYSLNDKLPVNFRSILLDSSSLFWDRFFRILRTAENVLLISVRLNNMNRVKRTLTKHFWVIPFFWRLMSYQSIRI